MPGWNPEDSVSVTKQHQRHYDFLVHLPHSQTDTLKRENQLVYKFVFYSYDQWRSNFVLKYRHQKTKPLFFDTVQPEAVSTG